MVISHNMAAMNGGRQLKINSGAKAKTTERYLYGDTFSLTPSPRSPPDTASARVKSILR